MWEWVQVGFGAAALASLIRSLAKSYNKSRFSWTVVGLFLLPYSIVLRKKYAAATMQDEKPLVCDLCMSFAMSVLLTVLYFVLGEVELTSGIVQVFPATGLSMLVLNKLKDGVVDAFFGTEITNRE